MQLSECCKFPRPRTKVCLECWGRKVYLLFWVWVQMMPESDTRSCALKIWNFRCKILYSKDVSWQNDYYEKTWRLPRTSSLSPWYCCWCLQPWRERERIFGIKIHNGLYSSPKFCQAVSISWELFSQKIVMHDDEFSESYVFCKIFYPSA